MKEVMCAVDELHYILRMWEIPSPIPIAVELADW